MQTLSKTFIIIAFLQIFISGINAQTSEPKLDQHTLIKQLLGSWKSELGNDIGNDTNIYITNILQQNGAKEYIKIFINNVIILEEESVWNYNKELDKYIISTISNGSKKEIYALWFTSEKKFTKIKLSDISNPDKASFMFEGEIALPDNILLSKIENSNRKIFSFVRDRNENQEGTRQNPKMNFPPEI